MWFIPQVIRFLWTTCVSTRVSQAWCPQIDIAWFLYGSFRPTFIFKKKSQSSPKLLYPSQHPESCTDYFCVLLQEGPLCAGRSGCTNTLCTKFFLIEMLNKPIIWKLLFLSALLNFCTAAVIPILQSTVTTGEINNTESLRLIQTHPHVRYRIHQGCILEPLPIWQIFFILGQCFLKFCLHPVCACLVSSTSTILIFSLPNEDVNSYNWETVTCWMWCDLSA